MPWVSQRSLAQMRLDSYERGKGMGAIQESNRHLELQIKRLHREAEAENARLQARKPPPRGDG